jgi:polyphosphate glucokinase
MTEIETLETNSEPQSMTESAPQPSTGSKTVLAVDIGGSNIKISLSTGSEKRAISSGPDMTPERMVAAVKQMAEGWAYDVIGIGYPGPVTKGVITVDPHNLGAGWKGFGFEAAFGKPVRTVNDALMQAIGGYEGGRMLFLGLGTGLGSAMIAENVAMPMELAHLPYKKLSTFEDFVGERGLKRRGKIKWRESVLDVVERLRAALQPDYIVIGGGNGDKLKTLPPNCRLGENRNAFLGAFRIWLDDGLKF